MKKYYVTTAIAYVNAPPHIGFALESVQADVVARFHRAKNERVFFLTGTDEHGAKVAKAAEAAGKSPKEFVDEVAEKFKVLKEPLNLSWDYFIRTSDQKTHWPNVNDIWSKLAAAGDIYKRKYRGLYCIGHEAFVTEKDLEGGICRDHKTKPEIIEEENYFFKLSKYGPAIHKLISSNKLRVVPALRGNEILRFIEQGLEDLSFSRPRKDLHWGIPVPGDESQTIYVWADALTNYLYPKDFWPADLHIVGKDILRFHALIWPAMLISAGLPLPRAIFSHGFITAEGQKMSKTIGNVIDPFELVKKYGTDPVRYYLLREIPAYEDGDFSYKKFEERYNGDLANGLGNFAARVSTLAAKTDFTGITKVSPTIEKKIEMVKKSVGGKMEDFRFHEALAAVWELISFGDAYVNEKKIWETKDIQVMFDLVVILDNLAAMLTPFLPETAEKITKSIIWEGSHLRVKKIEALFPRFK